jgi:hypothetical protein
MRILIISDSLGSPRFDMPVEKIWTYKIMKEHSTQGHVLFTIIRHGLYTKQLDYEQIVNFKADVIICQVGIVDCVRRAMPDILVRIVAHLPGVRLVVRKYVNKHHYQITKLVNTKRTKEDVFRQNIKKINNACQKVCFVTIADAGKILREKTYNCQNDIDKYNQIMQEEGCVINPYEKYLAEEYVLEADGHHLNELGHNLVFESVNRKLNEYLSSE